MDTTTNTVPTVYSDKRKNHRHLAHAKAIIRRIKPELPTRLTVYTKDITPTGACFFVADSIVWTPGDIISTVFIIELDKSTVKRSDLLRLQWRQAQVIWSANGRIGVEFLRDKDGNIWIR